MSIDPPPGWPATDMATTFEILTAPGAPYELEEVEIRDQRIRVFRNAFPSLRAVFEAARQWDERDFLVFGEERLGYRAHRKAVTALAHRLVDRFGIEKGDRVVVVMRNYPDWSIAFWAITAIGAIAVPLNAWGVGRELVHGITDSGAKLAFLDGERLNRLRDQPDELAGVALVLCRGEGVDIAGTISLADLIGPADAYDTLPDIDLPPVEILPEDDATIFYTSGTTGTPKGAVGSHRNIATNLMSRTFSAARAAVRRGAPVPPLVPSAATPQRAQLLTVPLFHVTGCHSTLVANLASGGKLVMMWRWDAERALELIDAERINSIGGVPTMAWQLLDCPALTTRDTSSLDTASFGGAAIGPELIRRLRQRFPGAWTGNGYGMTETSSITTHNTAEDHLARPDSVGVAIPPCDLRVVDPDSGRDVPAGESGELWIRGPNVVRGYWNQPEATAKIFADGWLRSGDIARIDDEGFVQILDRIKDMVIRGGENIYCVEVEEALLSHPLVLEAAVFGLPHPTLGEEPAATVRPRAGAELTVEALRDHLAARLAAFKRPTRIDIRATPLPQNASGKVLKTELRDGMLAEN